MRNILLVDDEPLVIVTLKSLIEWEKYDLKIVMALSNGEEALNYILNHPGKVDVVISDVDMPKMDGIELGKNLRRRQIDVAIIFLSAYSNFDYVREAFHNGACDYLLKNEMDEQKIIDVLTSQKIMKKNKEIVATYDIDDDRKSYIYNIINGVDDKSLTFERCKFKIEFPFILLFIKLSDIDKINNRLEILTVLEQENVEILTVDLQHYALLVPNNFDINKIINHINSNLWNYMNIMFDYKITEGIKNDEDFEINLKKIFDSFKSYSRLISLTRKYISENYKDFNLNLTTIANEVCVSKCHLSKDYSKETGETVVEYISKIRVKEAKKLLDQTSFKTYEIAELVGFSNVETFYRTFKKVCGQTPKNYRNK